jgi:HEAT repeat protein
MKDDTRRQKSTPEIDRVNRLGCTIPRADAADRHRPDSQNRVLPLRIYLASPTDVRDEREQARLLIERLRRDPSFRYRVALEVIAWDDPHCPSPMLAQLTPQAAVNRNLRKPADCDIVIIILWTRMGTPLPSEFRSSTGRLYESGWEWEYENALTGHPIPDILIYRRTEPLNITVEDPRSPVIQRSLDQYQRLLEFFQRLQNEDGSLQGGCIDYNTTTDFVFRLETDLRNLIEFKLETRASEGADVPSAEKSEVPISYWQNPPYPGLRSFTSQETAIFFGRSKEVDALLLQLRQASNRIVAVVGGSGTGKSSLVNAGLLPRLSAGAIEDSQHWPVITLSPASAGNNPFLALGIELNRLLPVRNREYPSCIAESLVESQEVRKYADAVLVERPESAVVLLFIDQFEELFTVADIYYRNLFAALLVDAVASSRMRIIVTLRSDFLPQCAVEPFQTLFQTSTFVLGAPGPAALADMIRRPAELAGLLLEGELIDEILKDAGNDPGALPLIACCLEELYEHSSNHNLSLTAYHTLGGLRGAIARRADLVTRQLPKAAALDLDIALPRLFSSLVYVDALGKAARSRAFHDELIDAGAGLLVDHLTKERLLAADNSGGRAVVMLAHEAIIDHWPALTNWIERNRSLMQRVQQLLLGLASADLGDRKYAATALSEIGRAAGDVAVSGLLNALGDSDYSVRSAAAEALYRYGPPVVPRLLTMLTTSKDSQTLMSVAQILGRIGPQSGCECVPALTNALQDVNSGVRQNAAIALGQFGSLAADAAPALRKLICDEDAGAREGAVKALGELGSGAREVTVPGLIDALKDPSLYVRQAAIEALRQLGTMAESAAPALAKVLIEDSYIYARQKAAAALGYVGSNAPGIALHALTSALNDSDINVRLSALRALGSMGPAAAAAVPTIAELLRGHGSAVRIAAAASLGDMGEQAVAAVPVLLGIADDPGSDATEAIFKALGRMGPGAVKYLVADLFGDNDGNREIIVQTLGKILTTFPEAIQNFQDALLVCEADFIAHRPFRGPVMSPAVALGKLGPCIVPALSVAIQTAKATVRAIAAAAMGHLEPMTENVIRLIARALHDRELNVRRAAAQALVRVVDSAGAKNVSPALVASASDLVGLLEDPDKLVRSDAIYILGEIGELPGPTTTLLGLNLYSEADPDIRSAAVEALGKIGSVSQQAFEALVHVLRDEDKAVRRNAAVALARVSPVTVAVPILADVLCDADESVRTGALFALNRFGQEAVADAAAIAADLNRLNPHYTETVPFLDEALSNSDQGVRFNAALALAHLGRSYSVPMLAIAVGNRDRRVRRRATEALKHVAPAAIEAIPALIVALKDADEEVRVNAAIVLGLLGPRGVIALETLEEAFCSPEVGVRLQVLEALKHLGQAAAKATPVLIRALCDEDQAVRVGAAAALSSLGPSAAEAAPPLAKALSDNDPIVRRQAADALRNIGAAAVVVLPALITALTDTDLDVRVNVAAALGALGSKASSAVPALLAAKGDPEAAVRHCAIEALKLIH